MAEQMISSVVKYIVWKLQEGEWSISKTKIVKLLYLIDIEYFRHYRVALTGFPWKYYYYGPYSSEIEDIFKRLHLDLPQEEVKTTKGHKAFVFRSSEDAEFEFNENVPQGARYVVERILRRWAPEELNPLLSFVYFDTGPMRSAKPGDLLDFSLIPPMKLEKKLDESVIHLTHNELDHFKEKLNEYKKKHALIASMSEKQGKILPSPANRAYMNAKTIMDDEEHRPLPENIDVIINEDVIAES